MRLILACSLVSVMSSPAFALSFYTKYVPNSAVYGCETCHVSTDPAIWNDFGKDVRWNLVVLKPDWETLCPMDSDGDGFTNGEELLDPDCLWQKDDPPPGDPAEVTHPGEADSKPFEPEPDVIEPEDAQDSLDVPEVSSEDAEPSETLDVEGPGPIEDAPELAEDAGAEDALLSSDASPAWPEDTLRPSIDPERSTESDTTSDEAPSERARESDSAPMLIEERDSGGCASSPSAPSTQPLLLTLLACAWWYRRRLSARAP